MPEFMGFLRDLDRMATDKKYGSLFLGMTCLPERGPQTANAKKCNPCGNKILTGTGLLGSLLGARRERESLVNTFTAFRKQTEILEVRALFGEC